MDFLNDFRCWSHALEERDRFDRMWEGRYAERLKLDTKGTNDCVPYHKEIAWQFYQMQQRIEILEGTIDIINDKLSKLKGTNDE